MARKQTRVVGQGIDLGLDAVYELLQAPAGKISTANRTREDQVAAEADAS